MNIVTDYWMGVDTELKDIDTRVKALRGDHMLQMRVKSLIRYWKVVEQDYKLYIQAVRAFMHEQVQHLLLFSSTRS